MGATDPSVLTRVRDALSLISGRRHRIVVDGVSVRYSERIFNEVMQEYGLTDPQALAERAADLDDGNRYLNRKELVAAARALSEPPPRYSPRILREVMDAHGLTDERELLQKAMEMGDGNRYLNRKELEAAARSLSLPELARGVPPGWLEVIRPALETPSFRALDEYLREERATQTVYPPPELVWNALVYTPLEAVKVVLLGQDPYHGPGEAMGLSFSLPPDKPIPSSLANIYEELAYDVGATHPGHGDLSAWARRGVLLLNAVLTVRKDKPASHRGQGWEEVSGAILEAVNAKPERVVFLLLGRDAQKNEARLDLSRHAVVKAAHPSFFSQAGFLKKRVFSRTNRALEAAGRSPIDWQIPPRN